MPTIAEELAASTKSLEAAGVETPRLDAELLLAHTLEVDRAQLVIRSKTQVPGDVMLEFRELSERRAEREPVAYLIGKRWFRSLELHVDPRVLIPRPETELLVELGLTLAQGARVLDIGTGSGAVALALKQERPDLTVQATDISSDAVSVAEANAARFGLDVHVVIGDLFAGLSNEFDAVLSNPPYVPMDDWSELAPEIVKYEPRSALISGEDGFDHLQLLAAEASARGVPLVACEIGAGQAERAQEIFATSGYPQVSTLSDLAGIERVVVARGLSGPAVPGE